MAIKTYVVGHGSITQGGKPHRTGAELDFEETEAKKMDPTIGAEGSGQCLILKSVYDAKQAGAKATKAALEASAKEEEHKQKQAGAKAGGK